VVIDPLLGREWTAVHHFYMNFYVYQAAATTRSKYRSQQTGEIRIDGISYELCKQPKSDLYRDLLPMP
jgi:hypothetical protein